MKINIEYGLRPESKELTGAIIAPHICYAYAVQEGKRVAAATGKTFAEARETLLKHLRMFAAMAKAQPPEAPRADAPPVAMPKKVPGTEIDVEVEG